MPAGVEVVVEGGFATIEFVDPNKRGPGLAALLAHTPSELIEKVTRPAVRYIVPEGNARAAGLLDKASRVSALAAPVVTSAADASGATPPEAPSVTELHAQTVRTGSYSDEFDKGGVVVGSAVVKPAVAESGLPPTGYDDGFPDMDWSRKAIDAYAAALTPPLDTTGEKNKQDAIAAIRGAAT